MLRAAREEPRRRDRRRRSGRLRRGARRDATPRRRDLDRHALTPGRQGLRAHRRATTRRSQLPDAAASSCRRALPARACRWRSTSQAQTCATARTRTSARPSTARCRVAPSTRRHAPSCCRARSSPTTTSPTPTRRWNASSSSTRPACVIVKHANPCGVAMAATCWTPTTAPTTPTRTPPSAASSPSTATLDAATAQAIVERQFVEVIIAPGGDRRPRARSSPRRRTCACWNAASSASEHGRRLRLQARQRRPAGAGRATLAATGCTNSRWSPSARPTDAGDGRPAVRLARGQVRQVQRHRLCHERHDHRRRRRPDEPRQLRAHRRHQGRARRARRCAAR